MMKMKRKGTVYLVGAGPGDPELLTLRGADLLRRADTVIYDLLVNPTLLRLARPESELISRGKRSEVSQNQINQMMISRAQAGKLVVRLKGGDPYIFGRGGEEAEALAAAKIPFEVVPGVSSIVAVPNYAGIPLTHRDYCSSFTVFTAHENPADAKTNLRYEQIAKIPGTKVALMGTDKLEGWTKSLIAHGMPPETPVAVVEWGTLGRQKSVSGTLQTIAALAHEKKLSPPALTIIGDVVKLREKLNWAEQRPLSGQRIVVTRSRLQAARFAQKLSALGAEVLEIPVVKGIPPDNKSDLVDAFLSLNSYDWLVFTSPNGVLAFFDLFFKQFPDLRDFGGARIAAVGPGTAAAVRSFYLEVNAMPKDFIGKNVAEAMAEDGSLENSKVCLFRAENASDDLPNALEEFGAIVDDIGIYQTVPEDADPGGISKNFLESGADWLTFTSGSTVEFFHARFNLPKLMDQFPRMKIAVIGPETAKAVRALNLAPHVEAREHTTDGLIAELLRTA